MRWLAVLLAVGTLAGCAARAGGPAGVGASASPMTHETLRGQWRGTVWETGTWYVQGHHRLDLRIDDNGTWRGTIDAQPASGVIRREDGQVVLGGTSQTPRGSIDPVYYRLMGDVDRLWGTTAANFAGRPGNATVSLERVD